MKGMVTLTGTARKPSRRRERARWTVRLAATALLQLFPAIAMAEDGYELWLRYRALAAEQAQPVRMQASELVSADEGPAIAAASAELRRGITGLLGTPLPVSEAVTRPGAIVIGSARSSTLIKGLGLELDALGPEGYLIRSMPVDGRPATVIGRRKTSASSTARSICCA